MADNDWKIAKRSLTCSVCNMALNSDQPFFSVLLQKNEGLARLEYCGACFQTQRPTEVYYFWKVAAPPAEGVEAPSRPSQINLDHVLEFFKRLEGEETPQKLAFRYILALLLTRKKLLVFEQKNRDAGGREIQVFREKHGGVAHEVCEPTLSDAEIATVSTELGTLLGLPSPTDAVAASAIPSEPAGSVEVETLRRTVE
ncbi:MAG: hypothetical protein V1899_04410 [Planctomycetota bacterium]